MQKKRDWTGYTFIEDGEKWRVLGRDRRKQVVDGQRFWRCAPETDLKDSILYNDHVLEGIEENGGRFGDGTEKTTEEILKSIKGEFIIDPETGKVSHMWGRTKEDLEMGRQLIEKLYGVYSDEDDELE